MESPLVNKYFKIVTINYEELYKDKILKKKLHSLY